MHKSNTSQLTFFVLAQGLGLLPLMITHWWRYQTECEARFSVARNLDAVE